MKFVSYIIASQLGKLGFNEECVSYFLNPKSTCFTMITVKRQNINIGYTLRPTHQQVVDWFRERHGLVLDVFQQSEKKTYTGKWAVDISLLGVYVEAESYPYKAFDDYYKAWDFTILEALKRLKIDEKLFNSGLVKGATVFDKGTNTKALIELVDLGAKHIVLDSTFGKSSDGMARDVYIKEFGHDGRYSLTPEEAEKRLTIL